MLGIITKNKWCNLADHWISNSHPKDMTKWFFRTIHITQLQKSSRKLWRRFNGMSYLTRRIHQTLLSWTTICFARWLMAWTSSMLFLTKVKKLGRFLDRLKRLWIFSTRNPHMHWKMGKSMANDGPYFE